MFLVPFPECFLFFFFSFFLLFQCGVCVVIFYFNVKPPKPVCLIMRYRKGVDPMGGEDLGGLEGGIIRLYYMRKFIFNFKKEGKKLLTSKKQNKQKREKLALSVLQNYVFSLWE